MTGFGNNPNDRWSNSIETGRQGEQKFAQALALHTTWLVEITNAEDRRATDMRITIPRETGDVTCPMDVKYLSSPYPGTRKTPAGLSPAEHLTLDVANVVKYSPDTLIMCVVDYTPKYDTKGVYGIKAGTVQRLMETNPERVYSRSMRSHQDKMKKVGVSINECKALVFDGMTQEETADACK